VDGVRAEGRRRGPWRWGTVNRYRHSFTDEPAFWRAYVLLDPVGGDYRTADEAKAAVEAAVEAAGRE
jgi:hypothetical protein